MSDATAEKDNQERLIDKGARYNLGAVRAQAGYHLAKIGEHGEGLLANGWTAAKTAELTAKDASLDTSDAVKADAVGAARQATYGQEAALDDAKRNIRKLRNVLPIVFRDHKIGGVTLAQFESGGKLGRSVNGVITYLNRIEGPAGKLDEQLKPYFSGQSLASELRRCKDALQGADASQEAKIASLPEGTRAVYAIKGRIVDLIEEANAIARNAFDGDATVIGQFNKDILLRGRRGKAAEPQE